MSESLENNQSRIEVSSGNTGAEFPPYTSVAYEGALSFHIQNPNLSAHISMNSAIYIAYKWNYWPALCNCTNPAASSIFQNTSAKMYLNTITKGMHILHFLNPPATRGVLTQIKHWLGPIEAMAS